MAVYLYLFQHYLSPQAEHKKKQQNRSTNPNSICIDEYVDIAKQRNHINNRREIHTYSQRSWSSSSNRCCPSFTFAIHWSKSISFRLLFWDSLLATLSPSSDSLPFPLRAKFLSLSRSRLNPKKTRKISMLVSLSSPSSFLFLLF